MSQDLEQSMDVFENIQPVGDAARIPGQAAWL